MLFNMVEITGFNIKVRYDLYQIDWILILLLVWERQFVGFRNYWASSHYLYTYNSLFTPNMPFMKLGISIQTTTIPCV